MLDYTLINNSWTTIRSGYIIKPNLYSESEIKTLISNDSYISKNAVGYLYCYLLDKYFPYTENDFKANNTVYAMIFGIYSSLSQLFLIYLMKIVP